MKRPITILSVACSLALIAGCGGGNDNASSTPKAPSSSASATPPAGKGAPAKPAGNPFAIAKGKATFQKTCIACHGEGGKGIEGLGKDWTTSTFIADHTDDELVAFLKVGRPLDDPLSAGNAVMPPKGGDPTLTDEDLRNVVAFMRTLNDVPGAEP